MIVKNLISQSLPLLLCTDTGQKAVSIMESFGIWHLPVVQDNILKGLISYQDIYDRELEMCHLDDKSLSLIHAFVNENEHVFEAAQKMHEHQITVIPVVDMNENYVGAVTNHILSENILKLFSAFEPGAIVVLEMNQVNYSLSQIAQIAESNNAKILSLYTNNPENTNKFDVTIKLNTSEISSLLQTFMRYNYQIKSVYKDNSVLNDMYSERYDLFMKYLNL